MGKPNPTAVFLRETRSFPCEVDSARHINPNHPFLFFLCALCARCANKPFLIDLLEGGRSAQTLISPPTRLFLVRAEAQRGIALPRFV
jgi:hypothetical protein